MTIIFSTMAIFGALLSAWAELSLPEGIDMAPVPPVKKVKDGPYRFMKHPMYVANVTVLAGLAGLGGGIWVALSVGLLTKLVMQQWVWLENGK